MKSEECEVAMIVLFFLGHGTRKCMPSGGGGGGVRGTLFTKEDFIL